MTRRLRVTLLLGGLLGAAALIGWSIAGLPRFGDYRGPYGYVLNRIAVPERHTTSVVGAVVFDYRGFDTLGEEFILFAAVLGVVLLLRGSGVEEEQRRQRRHRIRSEALHVVGVLAIGVVVLTGLWLAAFGYVTPGGGFQGGVVVAGGVLLLYFASGARRFRRFTDETFLDPLEATGAGGYAAVGVAALLAGLPFLKNLFGPGDTGTLWSGGSIALLNWASAIEVAVANVVLYSEFIDQYVVPLARRMR